MNGSQSSHGSREKEIFLNALEKESAEDRARYVEAACGNDSTLRAAVEELLRNHLADAFLEQPATLIESAVDAQRRQAAAGDPFTPGELFADRYRIVGLIGEGGMGRVYRADDLKLGQSVALKFLPPALATDPVWLLRFRNEVRIAREVAHPNVCRVYDIGDAEGEHFISMEFVDGEDLTSLLRRIGRLPQDKAVEIARQLCAGLSAAHARGVVHRDLKPANIMIDGRGKVRITDFGIAALAGHVQGQEIRAGTPSYMAPEQLTGAEVTTRSDIYALGLVLYEIFTGKKAVDGATLTQVERVQSRGAPPTPASHVRDLDPQVERIILRCLEPDAKNRPRSAMAVAAALPGTDLLAEAIAAGDTPSPELLAEAGESGALRPWVAIAGWFGVLLALVGVLAVKSRTNLLRFIPPPKPPEVLAERAEQILTRLGHTNVAADKAGGFAYERTGLRYLTNIPTASDRLKQLATGRPSPLVFWYRSSPRAMKPISSELRVTLADPPFTEPGMERIRLDGQGRLLSFAAVPRKSQVLGDSSREADWSPVFEEAALTITNFTRVAINSTPEIYCDHVVAWTNTFPGWPRETLRVEAGSIAGQPVFFQVIGPWRDAPMKPSGRSTSDNSVFSTLMRVVIGAIVLLVAGTAVILARRNLLTGRGDRIGARRLGISFFLIASGTDICSAHLFSSDYVMPLLVPLFQDIGSGFLAWMLYLGVEPYARRYWPHTLVSWSRLWTGRWRDPSLGRDILIGCLAGLVWLFLEAVEFAPESWTGEAPSDPYITGNLALLFGGRRAIGAVLGHFLTVLFNLGFFLFLLLLRILVKRDWITIGLFTGTLVILFIGTSSYSSWLAWISALAYALILALVPVRFGLLALILMIITWDLLYDPLPFDVSAWWFGTGTICPLLVLALATYGCWISMAGQPLFKDEMLAK